MDKIFSDKLISDFINWIGEENLRWFKHLKGLTGTYAPVLKLNQKRKGIPVHPVHFREGMQIRNWMRQQKECENWSSEKLDNNWTVLIEETINKQFCRYCKKPIQIDNNISKYGDGTYSCSDCERSINIIDMTPDDWKSDNSFWM